MKHLIYAGCLFVFLTSFLLLGAEVEVSGGVEEATRINKGSIFETFKAGGWVMWPILLCSLVGVAYGVERFINLRVSNVIPSRLNNEYEIVMESLKSGKITMTEAGHKLRLEGHSEAELLFDRFLKREYTNMRDVEQVLQDYIEITQFRMQKNVKPLGLVAQVSPLLGLFGTVLGMRLGERKRRLVGARAFDLTLLRVSLQPTQNKQLCAHAQLSCTICCVYLLACCLPACP